MVKNISKEINNKNEVKKSKKLKRPLDDLQTNNIEKPKKSKIDVKKDNCVNNKFDWFVTLNTKNIDEIKLETSDTSENENNIKTNNDSITICDVKNTNCQQKNSPNNKNNNNIISITSKKNKILQDDNIKNEISSDAETVIIENTKSKKKNKKKTSHNIKNLLDQKCDISELVSTSVQTSFEPINDSNDSDDGKNNVENKITPFIPKKMRSKSFGMGKNKIPEPDTADIVYNNDDDNDFEEDSKVFKLTEEDAMKLRKMHIKLNHTPPIQHCIEKHAGSTTLTQTEKDEFNKYVQLKQGPFSHDEDNILKQNWTDFCLLNDWDKNNVKPFLHLRHNYGFYIPNLEERKNFLRFLGKGLDNRSLYSIFRHFKILFQKKKVKRYTKKEDEFIIKCLKNSSKKNKCSMIAAELKRSNQSVWRRIQVLQTNILNKSKNN